MARMTDGIRSDRGGRFQPELGGVSAKGRLFPRVTD